jgi:hypothetical protein
MDDARTESIIVATFAIPVGCSNHSARSHLHPQLWARSIPRKRNDAMTDEQIIQTNGPIKVPIPKVITTLKST